MAAMNYKEYAVPYEYNIYNDAVFRFEQCVLFALCVPNAGQVAIASFKGLFHTQA